MGVVLGFVAVIANLVGGKEAVEEFGGRLIWMVAIYPAAGLFVGAAAAVVSPAVTAPWRAYVAGLVLGAPLAAAARWVLWGGQPWAWRDAAVLGFTLLALGGPLGITFWRDAQRQPGPGRS